MRTIQEVLNGRTIAWFLLLFIGVVCMPDDARARGVTPDEYQALSPLCQALFGQGGSRKERLRPFAAQLAGSCGLIHTRNGQLAMLRYGRASMFKPGLPGSKTRVNHERQRKFLLSTKAAQFGYEIRCAPPIYPLSPMIHTERGRALSVAENHSEAIKDFACALQLDPGLPARAAGPCSGAGAIGCAEAVEVGI